VQISIALAVAAARRCHIGLHIWRGEVADDRGVSPASSGVSSVAQGRTYVLGTWGHFVIHYASDGFFALPMQIAVVHVERGVFRCRRLASIFTTKSCRVGVRRREEDDRRSGRDDGNVETIHLT